MLLVALNAINRPTNHNTINQSGDEKLLISDYIMINQLITLIFYWRLELLACNGIVTSTS
jgi:hypothetical protein